jgi:transposase InsO family protein
LYWREIYEKDYASFEDFSKAVEEYIDYYNNKRIQAKTKWMPPVQYRIASMCSAYFINMCPGF